jgi:hypothetical protein
LVLALGLIACLLTPRPASAASGRELQSPAAAVASGLKPLASLPASQRLSLAISLPVRDAAALASLSQQIQDPASPNYRHYLTSAQFAAQFGPTPVDYAAVAAFARSHRLSVTATHPNRLILDVNGTVADIEAAFHITLRTYRHPREPRLFFAPDRVPTVDPALPISGVSGLDDYSLPRPRLQNDSSTASNATDGGSGPHGAYTGNDLRAAYVPGSKLNGAGQTVALVEFDGYNPADITAYERTTSRPSAHITNVRLGGFNGKPMDPQASGEVCLDIEMIIAMAPSARINVYEAGTDSQWISILSRIAADDNAPQVSCSWYSNDLADKTTADSLFQEMAVQGQSFFAASGDKDAYTGTIPFPDDNPLVTVVGGTTLTTDGRRGPYYSETTWNWGNGAGSSGGISTYYPIPAWQQGIDMGAAGGSSSFRNIPDVAAVADNVYVRAGGQNRALGGTSCAAPLWAAFTALVNQQATFHGRGAVGFLNPALYAIASGSDYGFAFHDITSGDNGDGWYYDPYFSAMPGYDLCTGLGSPGPFLIDVLAGDSDPLQISFSIFNSAGIVHGPFGPLSHAYQIVNTSGSTVSWSASAGHSWLTISPSQGTLVAGGSATVLASIAGPASREPDGIYSNSITFTDESTRVRQIRPVLLTISPPVSYLQVSSSGSQDIDFSGSQGGPFSLVPGASGTFVISNKGNVPAPWAIHTGASWLDVSPSSGIIQVGGTASFAISVDPSANTYGPGDNEATLQVVDGITHHGSAISATLTILPPPPVITSAVTATASQGNPFSYQVTATNSPTSFSAENLPAGLVLDTASGLITGSPIGSGTATFTIGAANAGGSASATVYLTVTPSAPVITGPGAASGWLGVPFNFTIVATNGPTQFGATGLPAGLSIDPASGIISGSVLASSTSNVTLTAGNAAGTGTASLLLTFTVSPPVTAFYFTSSSSAWVGGGDTELYTSTGGAAIGDDGATVGNSVYFTIIGPSYAYWWYLNFAVPSSQTLSPGTYANATRYPFEPSTAPGLSFYGDGRGDNQSTGIFTVLEAVYTSGTLTSFAADFVQFDELSLNAWNEGSIRYNSHVPVDYLPPPVIDSASATPFAADKELLNASVNAAGLTGSCQFFYGQTASYGFSTPVQSFARSPADAAITATPAGLQAGATYHYKCVATTPAGTVSTPDGTFTTFAVTPPLPVITSATSALASEGQSSTYQITASNGPISFGASNLPPGFSVDPNTGIISGTPYSPGTYQSTIQATNGGGTGSAVLQIVVLPYPPTVYPSNSITGIVGQPLRYQIYAWNNPTSFSATGLPPGLSIDSATGLISGTVATTGTTIASISASNAGGTGTGSLTISIFELPVITSATNVIATQGQPFTYQITATAGANQFEATNLPPGLTVDSSIGKITGAPLYSGLTNINISASNPGGTGTANLALDVVPSSPVITSTGTILGGVNVPILPYQVSAANFPTAYSAVGLPAGIAINTLTGVITGTPTTMGTNQVTLAASNAAGTGSTGILAIVSATPPPITAFYYYSSSSAYVGGGGTQIFSPGAGDTITGAGTMGNYIVNFSITGPNWTDWWYLYFACPVGQTITTGTYLGATREPFQPSNGNGLSFYGDGRGDNILTGSFIVQDSTYNPDGSMHSFAADFLQFDEGNTNAWNVGSIRFNSTVPITLAAPPEIGAAAASALAPGTVLFTGTANSNGPPLTLSFQYGRDATYGSSTAAQSCLASLIPNSASFTVANLSPNTTYHYQLVAASVSGTSYSPDAIIATPSADVAMSETSDAAVDVAQAATSIIDPADAMPFRGVLKALR